MHTDTRCTQTQKNAPGGMQYLGVHHSIPPALLWIAVTITAGTAPSACGACKGSALFGWGEMDRQPGCYPSALQTCSSTSKHAERREKN